MKKFNFFFGILVLTVCVSFGQGNYSEVVETGENNSATADQQGSDNTSYINQSSESNEAVVTQINSKLWEENAILSLINQAGSFNKAEVTQTHDGNLEVRAGLIEARIDQSGNENEAIQKQGPHFMLGTAFAEIIQSGNANYATQNQVKYGNSAVIKQSGNQNVANQGQDAGLLPDDEGSMNIALIDQSGNENEAAQVQDGWANETYAFQSGSNNLLAQNQSIAWVSKAFADQSGSDNVATQTQFGRLNNAKLEQLSNANSATQLQTSFGERATAVYDPLNDAEIYQSAGDGNVASQCQFVPAEVMPEVLPNYAYIWQEGCGNLATQDQAGAANCSNITQTGNGHISIVTQSQALLVE